jgi:hypothetical protein
VARSDAAHAEGFGTQANGQAAHAEGFATTADGSSAHAEGLGTTATGHNAHAEGAGTNAVGVSAHAEGGGTTAKGEGSHAEGGGNTAGGPYAHAEGGGFDPGGHPAPSVATGPSAHAEGVNTLAQGFAAHAEGGTVDATIAAGPQAVGDFSHAEGRSSIAGGTAAHAEGHHSSAQGDFSHAEGVETAANGVAAHAEGQATAADGTASHAEGLRTRASGDYSHAEGHLTDTAGHTGSHIMGEAGHATHDLSWFLANHGIVAAIYGVKRFVLPGDACFNGQVHALAGFVTGAGCDYAELFETLDGQPIPPGYFVTLEGDRVKLVTTTDSYVLGVTTVSPGVLASQDLERFYETDSWGRVIMEDVVVQAVTGQEGTALSAPPVESRLKKRRQSGAGDDQPASLEDHMHSGRVAVALIGQLRVRDDGSCEVNGYCRPNPAGVATNASFGYRVMKRLSPDQILILFSGPSVLGP